MWARFAMACGGLSGCAGVALGALLAHALGQRLDAHGLATLETVSRYLLVHGVLLVALAAWQRGHSGSITLKLAILCAAIGLVLFCGGLTASTLSGERTLGAAAPFGGSAFMVAWLACAAFACRRID